jgi:peptidoglycan hydrolase CwlO-like protein
VKKFTEQEDQIEKFRGDIRELETKINAQQKLLDAYLLGLDVS